MPVERYREDLRSEAAAIGSRSVQLSVCSLSQPSVGISHGPVIGTKCGKELKSHGAVRVLDEREKQKIQNETCPEYCGRSRN